MFPFYENWFLFITVSIKFQFSELELELIYFSLVNMSSKSFSSFFITIEFHEI